MYRLFCLFICCILSINCYADSTSPNWARYAIESSIATGGNFGIGLTRYTPETEIGFSISGLSNNAKHDTKIIVPVLFGGFRRPLCDATYFAYGLDFARVIGRENGEHIKQNIQGAIYLSLERSLSERFELVGWIDPYAYQYEKTSSHSVGTHRIFAAGGVAFSYFIS